MDNFNQSLIRLSSVEPQPFKKARLTVCNFDFQEPKGSLFRESPLLERKKTMPKLSALQSRLSHYSEHEAHKNTRSDKFLAGQGRTSELANPETRNLQLDKVSSENKLPVISRFSLELNLLHTSTQNKSDPSSLMKSQSLLSMPANQPSIAKVNFKNKYARYREVTEKNITVQTKNSEYVSERVPAPAAEHSSTKGENIDRLRSTEHKNIDHFQSPAKIIYIRNLSISSSKALLQPEKRTTSNINMLLARLKEAEKKNKVPSIGSRRKSREAPHELTTNKLKCQFLPKLGHKQQIMRNFSKKILAGRLRAERDRDWQGSEARGGNLMTGWGSDEVEEAIQF